MRVVSHCDKVKITPEADAAIDQSVSDSIDKILDMAVSQEDVEHFTSEVCEFLDDLAFRVEIGIDEPIG